MQAPSIDHRPATIRAATRARYLETLRGAMSRPAGNGSERALDAFLTLNAGYFLGEWLPARMHAALVGRLAAGLDGLAGLPLPAEPWRRVQLAQHVRELAAAFGPGEWTGDMSARTAVHVPLRAEDWDARMRAAAEALRGQDDGRPLLLAHARRRLWELNHPPRAEREAAPVDPARLYRGARGAATGGGPGIQVAEAALAEVSAHPHLADTLLPVVQHALAR